MSKENSEIKELLNDEKKEDVKNEGEKKKVGIKFNTLLDQLILIAGSALITILIDFLLPYAGYQLVKDQGAMYLVTLVIYFIGNCIYGPIAQNKREKKLLQNQG